MVHDSPVVALAMAVGVGFGGNKLFPSAGKVDSVQNRFEQESALSLADKKEQ